MVLAWLWDHPIPVGAAALVWLVGWPPDDPPPYWSLDRWIVTLWTLLVYVVLLNDGGDPGAPPPPVVDLPPPGGVPFPVDPVAPPVDPVAPPVDPVGAPPGGASAWWTVGATALVWTVAGVAVCSTAMFISSIVP